MQPKDMAPGPEARVDGFLTLVCIECGIDFEAKRSHARFCGQKCQSLNYRSRPKAKCCCPGCDRKAHALGLCITHYGKKRWGDPQWDAPIRPQYPVRAGRKFCPECGLDKDAKEFRGYGTSRALGSRCRDCSKEYDREWRRANPTSVKESQLQHDYGIGVDDYEFMLAAQGGVCAICGLECRIRARLAVDHDHETGQVRQLLCRDCNLGLGNFRDDMGLMLSAVEYLRRHQRVAK